MRDALYLILAVVGARGVNGALRRLEQQQQCASTLPEWLTHPLGRRDTQSCTNGVQHCPVGDYDCDRCGSCCGSGCAPEYGVCCSSTSNANCPAGYACCDAEASYCCPSELTFCCSTAFGYTCCITGQVCGVNGCHAGSASYTVAVVTTTTTSTTTDYSATVVYSTQLATVTTTKPVTVFNTVTVSTTGVATIVSYITSTQFVKRTLQHEEIPTSQLLASADQKVATPGFPSIATAIPTSESTSARRALQRRLETSYFTHWSFVWLGVNSVSTSVIPITSTITATVTPVSTIATTVFVGVTSNTTIFSTVVATVSTVPSSPPSPLSSAVSSAVSSVASSAASSPASSLVPNPVPNPVPDPVPDAQSSNKLSTGAIAGIAVGGVAVLALIVIIVIIYLKKKKNAQMSSNVSSTNQNGNAQTGGNSSAAGLGGLQGGTAAVAQDKGQDDLGPVNDDHVPILYTALKEETIRVLEICSGNRGEAIVCRLWRHSLASGRTSTNNWPGYEAVSYVWSPDPLSSDTSTAPEVISVINSDQSHILVPFRISWNLKRALEHMRLTRSSRVVWVDQICVNQHKTLGPREKAMQQLPGAPAQQLLLMHEVYRKATQVVAWMGELHTLGPLFELGRANTRLGTRLTPVQESALQDFANRDYWSRVWIVQEMVLAPSDTSFFGGRNCLVFQCDDMVLEYDRLGAIIEIINPNYFHSADVYNIFPEIARGSALSAVRSAIRPIQLLRTQLRKSDNTGISRPRLLNLVQWLRKWRCGEPVDRIFGLSKMVQTSDFALTPAGYQANNEPEVGTSPQRNDSFLEAIRNHESMFIYGESMSNHPGARTTLFGLTQTFGGLVVTNARLHGRLDGLNCHTGRAVQALPTWVPDFTALSTRHSLIETAGLPAPWTADGAAYVNDDVQGTAVSRPPHVVWDNLGCLSVHGLLCDEIAELAAPLTVPPGAATSVERVHDEMRAWAGHPEVWGRIDAWRRTTPYDQMGTAGGFDGAVRRAAFGSREVLTSNGVFTQAAVDFLDQANSDGGSPFNPLEQMVEVCPEGVLSVQLNRRFFRTRRGLIGVGPDDARIGDRLVMLFGGPTPYLLRARHLHWPESWVFVGDCYAHGLMGSTALEEWERQGAVPPRNEPDTDEWQAKAFLLV